MPARLRAAPCRGPVGVCLEIGRLEIPVPPPSQGLPASPTASELPAVGDTTKAYLTGRRPADATPMAPRRRSVTQAAVAPMCDEEAALRSETRRTPAPALAERFRSRTRILRVSPVLAGGRSRRTIVPLMANAIPGGMSEPSNPRFVLLRAAASLQAVVIGSVVVITDLAVLNLEHPMRAPASSYVHSHKNIWEFFKRASGTAFAWFP